MKKAKPLFGAALFVSSAILLIRGGARLFQPEIWAEDGTIYIVEALENGWTSLFIPFGGYYHSLQRIFTFAMISMVPIEWWPAAITTACYLLMALASSMIARPEYRWLIPSDPVRIFTAGLLCFTPGMFEVTGNLANINWVLVLWVVMLGLRDPKYSVKTWEMVGIALVIISTGTTFCLIPLFLFRQTLCVDQAKRRNTVIVIMLLVGVGLLGLRYVTGDRGAGQYAPSKEVQVTKTEVIEKGPLSYSSYVLRSVIVRPWLGPGLADKGVSKILKQSWIGWFVLFLLWGGAFVWYRKDKSSNRRLVFWMCLGISLWPVAAWFARPQSLYKFLEGGYFSHRYGFPIGFAATLFWVGLLSFRPFSRGKRPTVCGVFLILYSIHSLDRFGLHAHASHHHSERTWSVYARPLWQSYRTGCPSAVTVPIFPKGWELRYESPKGCSPHSVSGFGTE